MRSPEQNPIRAFGRRVHIALNCLFSTCFVHFKLGRRGKHNSNVDRSAGSARIDSSTREAVANAPDCEEPVQWAPGRRQEPSSSPHSPGNGQTTATAGDSIPSQTTSRARRRRDQEVENHYRSTKTKSASRRPEKLGPLTGALIDDRFEVKDVIDKVAFGEVYEGYDRRTDRKVAIKREFRGRKGLNLESRVYSKLREKGQHIHFPRMYYSGSYNGYNVLVIDMMGRAVDNLRTEDGGLFCPMIATLACDVLTSLEALHSIGYVHCDLKPGNILTSRSFQEREARDFGKYYLIDFGIAMRYMSDKGQHLERQWLEFFSGTEDFATPTAHDGYAQSRRDDILSLGFVLLRLLGIDLPWSIAKMETYQVGIVKKGTTIKQLCEGAPKEMEEWFVEVGKLGYKDEPDYNKFKAIALRLAERKSSYIQDVTFANLFDDARQPSLCA